jgi:hypothetical protein
MIHSKNIDKEIVLPTCIEMQMNLEISGVCLALENKKHKYKESYSYETSDPVLF